MDLLAAFYSLVSLRPALSSPPSWHRTYCVLPMPSMPPASTSTSYLSYRIVLYNFPLSFTWLSCANNLTKHLDLLIASYSQLSLWPASSPPSWHRTHHVLPMPSTPLAFLLTSYLSCCIILYNFPLSVTWRAVLTISPSPWILSPCHIRDCIWSRHHHILLIPSMPLASSSLPFSLTS